MSGTTKSLRTLIASDAYPDIRWGIKIRGGNVGQEGDVRTIPHFCAFLPKHHLATCEDWDLPLEQAGREADNADKMARGGPRRP